MAGKVYRPDHTAHIRAELAQTASYFATGLVVVLLSGGAIALVLHLAGPAHPPSWLVRALWIVGPIAITAPLTGLALTAVR